MRDGRAGQVVTVALDRTKIKADASEHQAISYERMKKREAELKAEIVGMLAAAEAADVEEDEDFGKDKRGDEMPDWASDNKKGRRRSRRRWWRWRPTPSWPRRKSAASRPKNSGEAEGRKKPANCGAAMDQPGPKAQRNFADPESRIMKSKEGFVQAYDARRRSTRGPDHCADDSRSAAAIRARSCPGRGHRQYPAAAGADSADAGDCSEAMKRS